MNAPVQLDGEDPWSVATNAVNAWRGGCMHAFTKAEIAVTNSLILLRQAGHPIRLRPLMGHRYADLLAAIGSSDREVAGFSEVESVLQQFSAYEGLRADLAHGACGITLKRDLSWVAIFRRITIRKGEPDRTEHVYEKAFAEQTLKKLKRDSQRVGDTLNKMSQSLAQKP